LEVSGAVRPIYGSLGVKRLIHSHTIPSSLKIYFFSVLSSAHWDPKFLFSSRFSINICVYLGAKIVQSRCKHPFSNKAILSIKVSKNYI